MTQFTSKAKILQTMRNETVLHAVEKNNSKTLVKRKEIDNQTANKVVPCFQLIS